MIQSNRPLKSFQNPNLLKCSHNLINSDNLIESVPNNYWLKIFPLILLQIHIQQCCQFPRHALSKLASRQDSRCQAWKSSYRIRICGPSFTKLERRWSSRKVDGKSIFLLYTWDSVFKSRLHANSPYLLP